MYLNIYTAQSLRKFSGPGNGPLVRLQAKRGGSMEGWYFGERPHL